MPASTVVTPNLPSNEPATRKSAGHTEGGKDMQGNFVLLAENHCSAAGSAWLEERIASMLKELHRCSGEGGHYNCRKLISVPSLKGIKKFNVRRMHDDTFDSKELCDSKPASKYHNESHHVRSNSGEREYSI